MIHSWGRISLFVLGYSAEASQRALVKRALLRHMTSIASTRIPAIANMGLTLPVLIAPCPTYFSPYCTVGRMARGPSAEGIQKSSSTLAGCARGPVEWPVCMQALYLDLNLVLTWLQRPGPLGLLLKSCLLLEILVQPSDCGEPGVRLYWLGGISASYHPC